MIRPPRATVWALVAALVSCASLTSGCGYALAGRGSFLPANIKIIGIPVFTNATPVFNLETQVTEKVRTEFLSRGKYRIQPAATGVDAVLTGSVTAVSIVPVSFTAQQLASRYAITLTASVELRDVAANVVLWENPGLIYRQEFEAQSGQAVLDPSAFFGQDASALDRITTDFARSIVSAILEAF